MTYNLSFIKEAIEDYNKLDNSQKIIVNKALKKILINPLPKSQGGYGKSLGNFSNSKLSGLLKIKLKKHGLRIIYKIQRLDNEILIIIIGTRADSKVYEDAKKRIMKSND